MAAMEFAVRSRQPMQFDRSARQAAVVCKLLTFNSRISNNAFFTTAVPKQCPRHSFAGHVSSSRRRRQVPLRPGAAPPFSDSESDDTASQPSTSTRRLPVDFEALAAAERSIAGQQAAGLPPSYSLEQTRVSPQRKLASEIDALRNFSAVPERIVETAMFAAITGLTYTLATLLKVESYLSYAMPLPIVLAAMRGGPIASVKALTVTFLLLLILMGPVRALSYLPTYGLLSAALAVSFSLKLPWAVSVPLGAAARVAGQLSYIVLSSWVANENLLALVLNNAYLTLDYLSAWIGTSGAPSFTAVVVTLGCMLAINATFYVFMMHLLFTLLLRGLGYNTRPGPKFLQNILGQSHPVLDRRPG